MANMSYCRFQNTLTDLRDCADHIGDVDLDEDEEKARARLVKLCAAILEDAEGCGLLDKEEDEEEEEEEK